MLILRGEDPVGEWTMTVRDTHNPDKSGRFIAWSLQLWGEAIDTDKVHDWAPAVIGQPDEEETGSQGTSTEVSQKPKPTDHLPEDHGEAGGEAHEPGIGEGPPVPSDAAEEHYDEGWFDGVSNLASNTSWMAGAGAIVVLAGVGVGGAFALRQRQKRRSRNLFGLSNNGEGARGSYAPVAEDVPMGLLERTRRGFGGGAGGGAAQSKELYDAFGDGPSEVDSDEEAPLGHGYHDGFLDDEEEGEYRDTADAGPVGETRAGGKRDDKEEKDSANQSTASSGSWLDTADDLK
jgi:kexin